MSSLRISRTSTWFPLSLGAASLVLLLATTGCGGEPHADHVEPMVDATEAAVNEVETGSTLMVHDAQLFLMPDMGALYMVVHNPGDQPDRLLRVETAAADAVETHESLEEDGVERMVARPEGFEVPASGRLVLEPGGKHVMLISPKVPEGSSDVEFVLHFEHAGAVDLRVATSGGAGGDDSMDHGEMDHDGH